MPQGVILNNNIINNYNNNYNNNSSVNLTRAGSLIPDGFFLLSEIARFCSYSQEYLSLLARRGDLKAKKFGRNWYSRVEWLSEYIADHSADQKGNVKGEIYFDNLPEEAKGVLVSSSSDVDSVETGQRESEIAVGHKLTKKVNQKKVSSSAVLQTSYKCAVMTFGFCKKLFLSLKRFSIFTKKILVDVESRFFVLEDWSSGVDTLEDWRESVGCFAFRAKPQQQKTHKPFARLENKLILEMYREKYLAEYDPPSFSMKNFVGLVMEFFGDISHQTRIVLEDIWRYPQILVRHNCLPARMHLVPVTVVSSVFVFMVIMVGSWSNPIKMTKVVDAIGSDLQFDMKIVKTSVEGWSEDTRYVFDKTTADWKDGVGNTASLSALVAEDVKIVAGDFTEAGWGEVVRGMDNLRQVPERVSKSLPVSGGDLGDLERANEYNASKIVGARDLAMKISREVEGVIISVREKCEPISEKVLAWVKGDVRVLEYPTIDKTGILGGEGDSLPMYISKGEGVDDVGVAIVPIGGESEKRREFYKNGIEESFSDEVNVYPEDGEVTGMIKPTKESQVFEDYMYVIVPIKNKSD